MKSQIPQRGGDMPARNALDAMMFSGTNFHIFFFSGEEASFILATRLSLYYKIHVHQNSVK